MTPHQLGILILVLFLLVIIVAAFTFRDSHRRRSVRLRERFGPEYDRVLRQEGDPRKAEGVLEFRQKRRGRYKLKPLSATDRASFLSRWNQVQAMFVQDPHGAIAVAENLVTDVMQRRGYPIGEFEQRAADISVDYPLLVQNYRLAHEISARQTAGQANTEELRQAMVHYRVLFQELLDEDQAHRKGA